MADAEKIVEIPVHIPTLDSTMAIACIVGGVVVGAILWYAISQQMNAGNLRSPFVAHEIIDPVPDGPGEIPAVYREN
jgi:hypothetical protein